MKWFRIGTSGWTNIRKIFPFSRKVSGMGISTLLTRLDEAEARSAMLYMETDARLGTV